MILKAKRAPLSELELHILMQVTREPKHGYALMQHIAAASHGWLKPGPGALYVALRRLVAAQLVAETSAANSPAPGRQRRFYRLTPRGRRAMAEELRRLRQIVRGAADAGLICEPD